jgi:hypothetical protein
MDLGMLRALASFVSRLLLGSAASAARQRLDHDARLVMTPRTLETALYGQSRQGANHPVPRRIGAFVVHEGGRSGRSPASKAPLGHRGPVSDSARRIGSSV